MRAQVGGSSGRRAAAWLALLGFVAADAPKLPPPVAPPGAVAATQPLSAEEASRLREVFDTFVQQGTNALAAGEYHAALEAMLDAKQLFERKMRGRTASVGSPEQVTLLHGLALIYQLVEKPDKASPLFESSTPLDRACSAKGVSRQLLVTRATLDSTQGYLAMRSVVSLTNYLKEHPDELDSEILDLLFTALQKADERVANRTLTLEPSIKLYEDFSKRLEATQPGKKRWGVQWVSNAEFDAQMAKRKAAIAKLDAAQDKLDEALAAVRVAERNFENSKKNGVYTKAGVQAASDRLQRANNVAYEKRKLVDEARAAIPPVPGLTKDDFKRILAPHDVDVVVSKTAKSTIAAADGSSRAIPFNLGGTSTAAKPPIASTAGGPKSVTSIYEPPPAAPPARRTFSRSATGFAVGPDLLLTTADAVKGAARVVIEFPGRTPVDATVERSGDDGLALLRITGPKMSYVNIATAFAGGAVQCPAFPEVSVFGVNMEVISGKALTPTDEGWKVALTKHPRLPGAPLLDSASHLIGIELGQREDLPDRLPALSFGKIKAFLAADLPAQPCPTPTAAQVVQITASFER